MLVTSRESGRWIIPKGWPWPQLADHDSAAGEAREEAGIVGSVEQVSFGTYDYGKRYSDGYTELSVDVFLLWVSEELADWPERSERKRAWFSPLEAAETVEEPKLSALLWAIRDLPPTRGRF